MGKKFKQNKVFFSFMEEKFWLEEMALKGYKLEKITMGIRYTFTMIEPRRLVYEVDRFNLPKHPTQAQIKEKDDVITMAEEMGWEVVAHDEDLNYYFCKEYDPTDSNELYNDLESRIHHASKFRMRYENVQKEMLQLTLVVDAIYLFLAIIMRFDFNHIGKIFTGFVLGYNIFCVSFALLYTYAGAKLYEELCLTKEEWLRKKDEEARTKKIHKVIFRAKKLKTYLEKQSMQGWQIKAMGCVTYIFEQGPCEEYEYCMDSKHLTNARNRRHGLDKIRDSKDINFINNDWQVQSVSDASNLGWELVCAYQNNTVLYRTVKESNRLPLNEKGRMPFVGVLSNGFVVYMGTCMIIGAIGGVCAAIFF